MKDIELLTNRFLAGETTMEEERRLYDLLKGDGVTAEQKMLRDIICPAVDEPDTDAWLMEDMTDEYDRVVAGRRRRHRFRVLGWCEVRRARGLQYTRCGKGGGKS